MFQTINKIKIYYQVFGEGESLFLLHGWGADSQTWQGIIDQLSSQFQVWTLDLPGFGQSDEPDFAWNISDYALFLKKLLNQLDRKKIFLLGHSFGGRIALKFARKYPQYLEKLILEATPAIKPPIGLKEIGAFLAAKTGNTVFSLPGLKRYKNKARQKLYDKIGKHDYEQTSGRMRKVFLNTINENLAPDLPFVKTETLILWGKEDEEIPWSMGKEMNQIIPVSDLLVFPDAGHFLHLDKPKEFCEYVIKFLKKRD